jgi:23S rRNA pseudouridine2605 synthase
MSDKTRDQRRPAAPGGQRIAKVMARAGLASRREAEAWIAAGRVAVNGAAVTSPGIRVGPRDRVTVDGAPLPQRERTRLFLFHKPAGLVTTNADPEGRPTIFGALPKHLPRLVTIGRLDFNTEGLLLLTNDGGLARVLEHPRTGWLRRYRVRAHGHVTQAQLDTLRDGVTVDGIHYGPIEATLDRPQGSNVWLTFAIREGKNREVRNVLRHLGLDVNRLLRVSFGPFQLGELAEGAVEEVRTRVLREQLGQKVADMAGADFDAAVVVREAPRAEREEPRREPGRPPRHAEMRGLERRASKGDSPHGRGRSSFEARGLRPRAPQDDRERSGGKPRPWRGRGREQPIADRAADGEPPRKTRSGLVTDRKGRRVLVQRVQTEPPGEPKPEQREPRHKRGKPPPRDRRRGPRPSAPRGKSRDGR